MSQKSNHQIYFPSYKMKRLEKFRTFFRTLIVKLQYRVGIFVVLYLNKKCRNACYSSVSASYPGRESNPHDRNGHRILSPDSKIT
jgi:hypothetical protein